MSTFDFRILLETVEGLQTSYYSSSFVNTSTELVLSASEVYHRITGSVSASYQNESIFSGSDVNPNFTFKDNTLLSASLSGSQETGSIVFTSLDTEYDRLLRYKFIGEKVTNTLGLPNDQWVYVDQVRLPVDDEANVFQGNANLGNVVISDTLTFAGGSDVNSDVPFLIDTGSDRYIKFVDERGISEVALRMGYDVDTDTYEISGSDDFTFNIGGINNLRGDITASGLFSFYKNVDGGSSVITVANTNVDSGTDKFAGIEFKHGGTNALGTGKPAFTAGKIIAGKDSNYLFAATNKDSNLQFFTALNGTDTEKLRIDSNGNVGIGTSVPTVALQVAGNISASGDIIGNRYIVNSTVSNITQSFSSGSTIFGDSADDTHQFTGNITASNNISASGGIFSGVHHFTSNVSDDYILYHPASDAIAIQSQDININASNGVGIGYAVTQNNSAKLDVNGNLKTTSHITASGNISASGDLIADNLYVENGKIYGDEAYNNFLRFNASSSLFKVQNKTFIKMDGSSGQREVTINEGTNDIDFVVKGKSSVGNGNPLFHTDANTHKIGMHGVGGPTAGLHIADDLWVSGSNGHITASGNISASGIVYGSQGYFESDNGTLLTLERNSDQNAAIVFKNTNGFMVAGIDEDIQNNGANIFGIGQYGDLIDNDGTNHATFVVTGSQVVINNATSASEDAALTVGGNISTDGDILNTTTVQMTNSSSVINTFNTSSFQTCKYVLQVKSGSHIQSSEMLVIQNSSNAFNTEYSQINSGLNLLDFTSKVNGTNVELIGSSSFISCSVKFNRTLI